MIDPWNPPSGLVEIVVFALPTTLSVIEDVVDETRKSGGVGRMVKGIVIWCVSDPEVAVTVTGTGALVGPAVPSAVSVKVLVSPAAGEGTLNEAVTPAGKPETARLTVPAKPFSEVLEITALAPKLCATETPAGPAMAKSDETVWERSMPSRTWPAPSATVRPVWRK
jgi:hypothetical protein